MKVCSICKQLKPFTQYHAHLNTSDRCRPECKDCGTSQELSHRQKIRKMWADGLLERPQSKLCPECKEIKKQSEFTVTTNNKSGLYAYCKDCNKIRSKRIRFTRITYRMLSTVKSRARRINVPFNLNIEDIVIPEYCPVLGIKIERSNQSFSSSSPSIDRIIPELGYVSGNIVIVSNRANLLKSDATIDELMALADYYKQFRGPCHAN